MLNKINLLNHRHLFNLCSRKGAVPMQSPFAVNVEPDWRGMLACLRREGTPRRVHAIELFLDREVQQGIVDRFALLPGADRDDPLYPCRRHLAVQQFLGYDYVRCTLDDFEVPLRTLTADDTAAEHPKAQRLYVDEHRGPITTWEELEQYPWPDPEAASTSALEWYDANLPEGMCIIGSGGFAHFYEWLSFLMGYETLCFALYEQRELVAALAERILAINRVLARRLLAFDRVRAIWGSDDLGFRSGTLISPADLRAFVFPGHRAMAQAAHAAGRPYLLHTCGHVGEIMDELIDDVGIDAKHSFEDTIESVIDAKRRYGRRIAVLGGLDVDFLCRADEAAIRRRVRDTLDACQPGGGYLLGTGNSVANYIPLAHYLVMLDEGRRYGG